MGDRVSLGTGCQIVIGVRRNDVLREAEILAGPHLSVWQLLQAEGTVPLPPYLQRPANDRDATEYQTVFARREGAIAAPTAGLHFTRPLLKTLGDRGIIKTEVTLHVGIGTFLPVRTEDPAQHVLQPEWYEISEETAHLLNTARAEGRRIIAVGTTSTRALEHVFATHGQFAPGSGKTDLYIRPGYQFRAIDGLITNFHLPRSTLALLVAAFASGELLLDAYRHAIQADYRFYSYGDCCLFF
jgi:S-adenosylmethionine:tRNA ribosyltransferase-isomerase